MIDWSRNQLGRTTLYKWGPMINIKSVLYKKWEKHASWIEDTNESSEVRTSYCLRLFLRKEASLFQTFMSFLGCFRLWFFLRFSLPNKLYLRPAKPGKWNVAYAWFHTECSRVNVS